MKDQDKGREPEGKGSIGDRLRCWAKEVDRGFRNVSRHRPSPAMVVALIALGISLTTGAYAAVNIPKNSVGPAQLKNNAVTAAKIKRGSVVSSKIDDGAVKAPQISAAAITSAKLKPGAVDAPALAAGAVGPDQIKDAAIGSDKLADRSIEGGKLKDGAVDKDKLATGSVDSAQIVGSAITAAKLAQGSVGTHALGTLPAARLLMNSNLIPTADNAAEGLSYDSVMFDTAAMYDPSEPGYLEAPVSGIYEYDVSATFAANGTGMRYLRVWHSYSSGAKVVGGQEVEANATGPTPLRATGTVQMAAGDQIQPFVIQKSGGPLDLVKNTDNVAGISLSYVAPAP